MNKLEIARLEKDISLANFKLKEHFQTLKLKNLELDDERRHRMKSEQKYNEQRQKGQQLEESLKNRETVDERRQREKEEQTRLKL